MLKQAVALLLIAGPLWGCAEKSYHDALVREALQEREVAYARLAKAITTYCSARNESLEARQNCILEKRLELFRIGQDSEDRSSTQIATDHAALYEIRDRNNLSSVVSCERTRLRVTCQPIYQAFTEYRGANPQLPPQVRDLR